ncbi:MAG: C40 family peptidase [Acidimicrobiaceae bacterium]|nr:C40 family peptidase [Acidimicrobiaceae bacterium]
MIRVRRRGTTRSIPLVVVAALVSMTMLVPLNAGALTIEQTQAEIAQLSSQLAQQSRTSETTANAYDAAKVALTNITFNIRHLHVEEVNKRAAVAVTSKRLQTAVVLAYVLGAADAQVLSLFTQNAAQSDARKVYESQVIGDLNQIKARYQAQKTSLDSTITQVAQQQAKAQRQTYAMQNLLAQNIRNENATRATLAVVTRTLRTQIIAYEIQKGVEAARSHNLALEEQAIAAATAVGGQSAANAVTVAIQQATVTTAIAQVGSSAQGLAALHYAESQIGVPYVWGGETPGVGFDCSGLVAWAWARAGIQIPRTTESQWPGMVHVPLTALQPGDLLFYYNLDGDHLVDHVVMYVGSGPWGSSTIIAAAHTGTTVSLAPIFTAGLIGAGRP